jgi:L-asparaginase
MKPSLTLLACGGTIDKDYNPITGELVFQDSYLPEMLIQSNHQLDIQLKTIMLKDSLEMDTQDREQLYQACLACENQLIVITHGTDTLTDSAEYINARSDKLNAKTLVFTGAMRPYKLGSSDALFNLGAALMAAQISQQGVYICMNGQLFSAGQVTKNRQLGIFTSCTLN